MSAIYTGHVLAELGKIPEESVDTCITSPPYYGLRNYGEDAATIWGGSPECDHQWCAKMPPNTVRHTDEGLETRDMSKIEGREYKQTDVAQDRPQNSGQLCRKCGAWMGQLGHEPHPEQYIAHLIEVSEAIRRVLNPKGTYWLNLGDTYYNSPSNMNTGTGLRDGAKTMGRVSRAYDKNGWLQEKQLLMIPARVAIALQDNGWILRNDIIWYKKNAMPTSAKDRFKPAHEHILFLAKRPRYYFNLDAIKKPYSESTLLRILQPTLEKQNGGPKQNQLRGAVMDNVRRDSNLGKFDPDIVEAAGNYGKSDAMVKHIARKWNETEHQKMDLEQGNHARSAATFNNEIARKATAERNKWEVAVERENRSYNDSLHSPETGFRNGEGATPPDVWDVPTHGYAGAHFATYPEELIEPIIKAACPPKGVVLDPFLGSGTTAAVAHRLHRTFIGVEINPAYVEIAWRRIRGEKRPVEGIQNLV